MSDFWVQRTMNLPRYARGGHLVTPLVVQALPEISQLGVGLLNVFLLHTSASITINENADTDVRTDLEMALNRLAPEDLPYDHTLEGPDDMPAHVKCSLLGCSLLIPVTNGHLSLGTWQGIYLVEHRDRADARRLMLTLWGQPIRPNAFPI